MKCPAQTSSKAQATGFGLDDAWPGKVKTDKVLLRRLAEKKTLIGFATSINCMEEMVAKT